MARKQTADKEITRVEEKPEGLLWLLKASENEILERLNAEDAIIFVHPALDGIVSFRIEENPQHEQ
jgi:hypothetical protein